MRIAYCTNIRLPNERAHGHQIAHVCDACVSLGHDVTIFVPFREAAIKEPLSRYYGVSAAIRLATLGRFDPIAANWIPRLLRIHVLNFLQKRRLGHAHLSGYDVLYIRSPSLLPTLLRANKPVILELHTLPRMRKRRFIRNCRRCALVVCLTSPMRDELIQWGVDPSLITVEADAVDPSFYRDPPDRESARRLFGIPENDVVLGYAGSLKTMGLNKGAEQLIEAAAILRKEQKSVSVLIAGGPQEEADQLLILAAERDIAAHVRCTGPLLREDVAAIYAASDILVYPAPATDHPYFTRDTSPLKLFEYMVAGKTIIAADLPPIHDILDTTLASFYPAGDFRALAEIIDEILHNSMMANVRAQRANEHVRQFTWPLRMERILSRVRS